MVRWLGSPLRTPSKPAQRASVSGVVPATRTEPPVPSERRARTYSDAKRRHALIVDDDAPSLRAFQRILAKHDVEILSASTVSEAFGLVSMLEPEPHPFVAFVDVLMPGMDGPRFVHALQRMPAFGFSPIVLVSALSANALEKAQIEWGANGFILKSRGLLQVDREFSSWLDRV